MIGLDTNIMVRYLVKDDPVQAKKASSFMRSHARKGEAKHKDEPIANMQKTIIRLL